LQKITFIVKNSEESVLTHFAVPEKYEYWKVNTFCERPSLPS
jgi:hypothetical protein